ncbi:hypothetical protein [Pseudomonas shirazensis]
MNTSNHRNSRSDNEGIISETMETKDPAINQHENSSNSDRYDSDHSFTENSDNKNEDQNEDIDPNFQKNSKIAQDLDEDLKNDNDPDRRTLDEYSANQAEPDEDEE